MSSFPRLVPVTTSKTTDLAAFYEKTRVKSRRVRVVNGWTVDGGKNREISPGPAGTGIEEHSLNVLDPVLKRVSWG